jgi:hypothetical protein
MLAGTEMHGISLDTVLGIIGALGVPIAIGIGVTMANPSHKEFNFARGCFILAAVLCLAITLWLTREYPLNLIRLVVTGAIGAAIAVALALGLDWIARRQHPTGPDQAAVSPGLFIECSFVPLPMKMARGDSIFVLNLWPTPIENGGGIGQMTLGESNEFKIPGIRYLHKCIVTSYEAKTLTAVNLDLRLVFQEAVKDGNTLRSGKTTLDRIWPVRIGKIDPGAPGAFVFYIFNVSKDFAQLSLPATATATPIGEQSTRTVPISTSNTYPISFPPPDATETKEKQGSAAPARAIERALIENPERIKASPVYLRLRNRLHPENGFLAPTNRVKEGKEEFQKLIERARERDYESYLIANEAGQWLISNARFCYASSTDFFEVLHLVESRMDEVHEIFRQAN